MNLDINANLNSEVRRGCAISVLLGIVYEFLILYVLYRQISSCPNSYRVGSYLRWCFRIYRIRADNVYVYVQFLFLVFIIWKIGWGFWSVVIFLSLLKKFLSSPVLFIVSKVWNISDYNYIFYSWYMSDCVIVLSTRGIFL